MKAASKPTRPVYLNLIAFRFPITAIASILHRITGVALVVGIVPVILLWQLSLQDAAGFSLAKAWLALDWVKWCLVVFAGCLLYHILAGVKHLLMDLGLGETRLSATVLSYLTILISLAATGGLAYLLVLRQLL